jgi:threonine dehydrogenase-like Zn-dependent dehydrogenase
VPKPEPGPGEIRIRLEGCGVCASNLEPWAGQEWMTYPGDAGGLGHEGWGVVDAVGEGVRAFAAGDRVATLSYRSLPIMTSRLPTWPQAPGPLAGKPFPGEPLGCAFNIFRRSDIRAGQTVAIIGIGFLGAVLTRLASDAGARVVAISRRQESLDLARHYGAARDDPDATITGDHRAGQGAHRRAMCERVIEAVGKQWPLDLAGALIGFGGKLVVAGYHQDGPRQVNMQDWNWKGIDVINAHERDPAVQMQGLREAVEAVASGRLDPEPLYTHRITAGAALADALDATRDKPGNFVKALVTMSCDAGA